MERQSNTINVLQLLRNVLVDEIAADQGDGYLCLPHTQAHEARDLLMATSGTQHEVVPHPPSHGFGELIQ